MKPAKRNNTIFFAALLFIICIFYGCKNKTIDDSVALKIYVENVVADEKYSAHPDSLVITRKKIYSKYKVNQSDYKAYLSNLKDDQEKWKEFFTNADLYLKEMNKKDIIK